MKKTIKGAPNVNMRELGRVSDHISSDNMLSSAKSGESNFRKRKVEKASVIKMAKEESIASSVGSEMNSSVSSVRINESVLNDMDSDVSVDFRKKRKGKA